MQEICMSLIPDLGSAISRRSQTAAPSAEKHCRIELVSMSCQGLRALARGWIPELGSDIS